MLLAEILSVVKSQPTDNNGTWVIELFAGYGSLRAIAKSQGLDYLAADMRELISAAIAKGSLSAATGK